MFNICWDVECGDATHHGLIHSTSNANKRNLLRFRQGRIVVSLWLARVAIRGRMGYRRYGGRVVCALGAPPDDMAGLVEPVA
ncbi:hypothetical protein GJA_129 [Janthinobacterium agaricidamnosum NBRC 102515 = DSM 9628]|uniref:Uncharacterized protein n=1 Tax=Janthinobacterium agaricidamnosum NBRC 102515 = DSM 9628 TaxID=1349767 RepID=W0UZI8_9BURK|nr:hypothetical protein GJA_129 [Janthinobacterium agaricidamnosum NBRC 102515 = DSM 9628]